MGFYEVIETLCDENQINVEQLHLKLDITQEVLNSYKQKNKQPTKDEIEKFSKLFGIRFNVLFCEFKVRKTSKQINIVFIIFNSLFLLVATLPIWRIFDLDYSNGSPPKQYYHLTTGLFATLKYGHPIVLINILICGFNILISILILKNKTIRKPLKVTHFVLLIIGFVLMLFSILGILKICSTPPIG